MRILRPALSFLFLLAGLQAAPTPARAAQSYDNCTGFIDSLPATIGTPGIWCLRHDASTAIASGGAITVATNNVTVDCNDFKVGGLAAGAGTAAVGIYAGGRLNTTIRNCSIRGFRSGIVLDDGGGHRVEHNSLDANTQVGIVVTGGGSTVRANRVIDTGGSTSATGTAYGLDVANGVDVLDNTVDGVAAIPSSGNATSYGIRTTANGDASVVGNRVRGLAASGTGTTYGIWNEASGRTIVRRNDLQGSGVAGSIGVYCSSNQATARANIVPGFVTAISGCLSDLPNLMFTTSSVFNGDLGGLAGADAKCQQLATSAGLKGNYRAYLGATNTNAPSRFAGASGWTRVDGSPMVELIGEFGTIALSYPPSLDESGVDLSQSDQLRVWTATNPDTSYAGQNCATLGGPDWSTTSARTVTGVLATTDAGVLIGGSVMPCGITARLYCFGIDRAATLQGSR